MKVEGIFDFLNILYNFTAVLEVGQHTRRPALVEQSALVVVQSDCRVDEGCYQSHNNQADVFFGQRGRDLGGFKRKNLFWG